MKIKQSEKLKPYLIGVTGSLGTGKSLVGKILSKSKVLVVDTDDIVGDILKSKNNTTKKIVKEFGRSILNGFPGEYINKKALGKVVFGNDSKRKKLESIIHPEVQKEIIHLIKDKTKKIIAVLVPLLFEAGWGNIFNEIWCVVCDKKTQLKRLLQKGYSLSDAKARIKAQLPQNIKAKQADFVIDNSGTVNNTKKQVANRLAQLNHSLHLFSYK